MMCKKCIQTYIGEPESSDYISRVNKVLAIMDKPFIFDEWENSGRLWTKYIPKISSLGQYKGMTYYNNSVFETKPVISSIGAPTDSEEVEDRSDYYKELADFWGLTKPEEIDFLQYEYEQLTNAYESEDSYAMRILFQEVSHLRLTIKKNRENNKPVDKELKTLQDLLGSANIKPVQETGANATDQATFGTLIKKYENERPIPEPDEAWKDVDGIKKYVQVWFLGHLCKMLGINNDYVEMYEEELAKHTVETPEYEDDSEEVTL